MKVRTIITGNTLTEGICFYGETDYDNETIDRLKQLAVVLEDVAFNLVDLNSQVEGRYESSAKKIRRQLNTIRNDLLWVVFDEGMAADIVELLGGEE